MIAVLVAAVAQVSAVEAAFVAVQVAAVEAVAEVALFLLGFLASAVAPFQGDCHASFFWPRSGQARPVSEALVFSILPVSAPLVFSVPLASALLVSAVRFWKRAAQLSGLEVLAYVVASQTRVRPPVPVSWDQYFKTIFC